jgi:signal transduction histidine kinase
MPNIIKQLQKGSGIKIPIFRPLFSQKSLSEIEKFTQLGQLSSGFLHDLTSPISALNLQIELLNEKNSNKEEYVKSIKESVIRVNEYSKLIKNYISGNTAKKLLSLNTLIEDTLKLISYKAVKQNIQINFIRNTDAEIYGNDVQVYQILISLISNAIESYREFDTNRKIIIKLENIQKKTEISIKDFGCGIKNTKRIFSHFYTTKQNSGGTGIGLSSVKYIIEKELNGKLEVESEVNKGSKFKIII